MIGWLAGRCDGENYGKLLVYNFPKSRLIDGPLQIEARIDQNAQLSGQFTLWNQQGSTVIRGHLLVIQSENHSFTSNRYICKRNTSPMPELRLVVLATQDKLAYGQNFAEAMNGLFGEAAKAQEETKPQSESSQPPASTAQPTPSPANTQNLQQLVNQAIQEFDDYQRLTSQGKLARGWTETGTAQTYAGRD